VPHQVVPILFLQQFLIGLTDLKLINSVFFLLESISVEALAFLTVEFDVFSFGQSLQHFLLLLDLFNLDISKLSSRSDFPCRW